MIDSPHAVDQVIASHILANIMYEIMRTSIWGNNLTDQLNGLRRTLDDWYGKNRHRHRIQSKLTIERIKNLWRLAKVKGRGRCDSAFVVFL